MGIVGFVKTLCYWRPVCDSSQLLAAADNGSEVSYALDRDQLLSELLSTSPDLDEQYGTVHEHCEGVIITPEPTFRPKQRYKLADNDVETLLRLIKRHKSVKIRTDDFNSSCYNTIAQIARTNPGVLYSFGGNVIEYDLEKWGRVKKRREKAEAKRASYLTASDVFEYVNVVRQDVKKARPEYEHVLSLVWYGREAFHPSTIDGMFYVTAGFLQAVMLIMPMRELRRLQSVKNIGWKKMRAGFMERYEGKDSLETVVRLLDKLVGIT